MAKKTMGGKIKLRLTSADIPGALRQLTEQNIQLKNVESESDLSIFLTISSRDYANTKAILEKRGDRVQVRHRFGLYWTLFALKSRCILLIGCILIFTLTVYIPSRIYFFEVKGNQNIPQRRILEKVELSGLTLGCKRASINSEQLKNSILQSIPQLDWVGVTTAGCVATIEVREKPMESKKGYNMFSVSHIVSACDGVVDSITATNGTPLCKVGQAVEKDQILISGYENCGLILKASRAEGEVFGKTIRTVNLITPLNYFKKNDTVCSEKKYSLQFGKNIINFSKDSGISPSGCVKMYSRQYISLPGGFQLPVAFICEETIYYDTSLFSAADEDFSWLTIKAEQYVLSQMNAGVILLHQSCMQCSQDICVYNGIYACREQIGKIKIEENLN